MTEIQSQPITVAASLKELTAYLSHADNLAFLMPEQVVRWESSGNRCRFAIKDTADIGMEYRHTSKEGHVIYDSCDPAPFPFQMIFRLKPSGDRMSEASILLMAELSPILAMMATGPLRRFTDMIVEKLAEIYGEQRPNPTDTGSP
ncbi:MAG: hypothetical protein JW861_06470 [Bacteroidales bacterium]|nr:hypothetical protein [Bacteroidales bacterium]